MARYQVRAGKQLPHNGHLFEAGEIVELPRHVAADSIVRDFVDEVDEAGNPVLAPLTHEFAQFRPHEQVTLLEGRLAEAQARVETLTAQIADAKQAVAVASPPRSAPALTTQDEE